VEQFALLCRLGVAEVVTTFLDSANCLTESFVRNVWIYIDQFILFWATGSYCEVLTAVRKPRNVGVGQEKWVCLGEGGKECEGEYGEHPELDVRIGGDIKDYALLFVCVCVVCTVHARTSA